MEGRMNYFYRFNRHLAEFMRPLRQWHGITGQRAYKTPGLGRFHRCKQRLRVRDQFEPTSCFGRPTLREKSPDRSSYHQQATHEYLLCHRGRYAYGTDQEFISVITPTIHATHDDDDEKYSKNKKKYYKINKLNKKQNTQKWNEFSLINQIVIDMLP